MHGTPVYQTGLRVPGGHRGLGGGSKEGSGCLEGVGGGGVPGMFMQGSNLQ